MCGINNCLSGVSLRKYNVRVRAPMVPNTAIPVRDAFEQHTPKKFCRVHDLFSLFACLEAGEVPVLLSEGGGMGCAAV